MSDFDFEELDKAVTGALGADTPSSSAPHASREPVREAPATARSEEVVTPRPEQSTPPAARRSAGRFMDVVHPSSDMRTKAQGFTPPTAPSQPAPTTESSVAPQEEPAWNQPLESPFLPDAKVEKRPLGAFALDTSSTESNEPEEEKELLLEAPDELRLEAHTMPDPIDFAAQASAPLSESEDTGAAEQPADEPVLEEAPVVETQQETEPVQPLELQPEKTSIPEPVKQEAPEPTGPASITQQYTEQPSSAPSSGAIYDTENYHAPLAPPPKKRSGFWVALWIFLLIVLGAGAGVAFYLFVLPML